MIYKKQINIDYLARTEGETALSILLDRESSIELKIFEPPRLFEGFLVGRKYDEVGAGGLRSKVKVRVCITACLI